MNKLENVEVKVYDREIYLGKVVIPKKYFNLEDVYNLCIWDKWLNEKPLNVEMKDSLSNLKKENIRLVTDLLFYSYDKDNRKWEVVEGI